MICRKVQKSNAVRELLITISMIFCMGVSLSPTAQAFELGVLGGLHNTNVSIDPTAAGVSYSSQAVPMFGAFIETSIVPLIGFELGAFYVPRKYKATVALVQTDVTTSLTQLQIPALIRFHLIPFLSFAAGGYYAHSMGDIHTEGKAFNIPVTQDATYDAVFLSQNEFGILGSVRLEIPVLPLFSLMADLRYLRELKNLNTSATSTTIKFHGTQFLVGASFGF